MAVYIPAMEMPDCCSNCCLLYDKISCIITGTPIYTSESLVINADSERLPNCPLGTAPDSVLLVDTGVYDVEEIYEDCTVQILRNSITGRTSIGWWENTPEEGDSS